MEAFSTEGLFVSFVDHLWDTEDGKSNFVAY